MQVETRVQLNMTTNRSQTAIDCMQNENLTRVLVAELYDNSAPWLVPDGVKAGVAFRKPDGKCGLYNQLPDGKSAVTVSGNTVRAIMVPQVQQISGNVDLSIVFMDPNTMERLATFPLILRVSRDPSAGSPVSNSYYKYSTMEEVNNALKNIMTSSYDPETKTLSVTFPTTM